MSSGGVNMTTTHSNQQIEAEAYIRLMTWFSAFEQGFGPDACNVSNSPCFQTLVLLAIQPERKGGCSRLDCFRYSCPHLAALIWLPSGFDCSYWACGKVWQLNACPSPF